METTQETQPILVTEESLEEQTNYLLTYDLQQAVIDELNKKAKEIVVADWKDEENYKKAKAYKSEINNLFKKIDRRRIDLKKFVDTKGKIVTALIQEPMKYLDSQIAVRDDEIRRQEEEVEAKIQNTIKERADLLAKEDLVIQNFLLHPDACDEPTFAKMLADAKELKDLRNLKAQQQELADKNKDATIEAQKEEIQKLKLGLGSTTRPLETVVPSFLLESEQSRVKELALLFPDYNSALVQIMTLEDEIVDLKAKAEALF